jgi:urea transport system permease protein
VRETIAAAVTASSSGEQREIILSLKITPSPEVVSWLEKWKEGGIFIHEGADGQTTAVLLTGKPDADDSFATVKLADGSPMLAPDGSAIRINPKAVDFADTDSGLRKAMKEVSDLAALANDAGRAMTGARRAIDRSNFARAWLRAALYEDVARRRLSLARW